VADICIVFPVVSLYWNDAVPLQREGLQAPYQLMDEIWSWLTNSGLYNYW